MGVAAIVLAAGAGTRMKSNLPKVAHEVLGKPLVNWVIDAAHAGGIERIVCVVGHGRELVEPLVEGQAETVFQPERKGTANAVEMCRETFGDFEGTIIVLNGDLPLITSQTISELVATRESQDAAAVILSMDLDDPTGYGRIIRGADGSVEGIVEQKDATPEQALITECNAGLYCFDARMLFDALEKVGNDNAQGEYYLTDVLALCREAGGKVAAYVAADATECLGVNSQEQLAEVEAIAKQRLQG
jgi:bifunctional UDP-N-acetylglucosamine pyrophosphorylase/glucosamine-1-phosphate N-acetyltransferase